MADFIANPSVDRPFVEGSDGQYVSKPYCSMNELLIDRGQRTPLLLVSCQLYPSPIAQSCHSAPGPSRATGRRGMGASVRQAHRPAWEQDPTLST